MTRIATTHRRRTAGARTPARNPIAAGMEAKAEIAAGMLKAMANAQRLRVLCLLVDGERSVGDINALVRLSQPALSQHLAVLRETGLVTTRREAQTVYYSLADGPVRALIGTLHQAYCGRPGH